MNIEKSAGELRYRGALFLASVFKVLAGLTLGGGLLGIVGAVASSNEANLGPAGAIAMTVVWLFTAIVTAGFFAFFGYVLEVLVDIWETTWLALDDDGDDEDDERPGRAAA